MSAIDNSNFANFTQFTLSDAASVDGAIDIPQLQVNDSQTRNGCNNSEKLTFRPFCFYV